MATKGIGKGVRSARGEMVDFDLLRIKENLATAPKGSTVKAREDFIDNKFKRRMRRLTEATAAAPAVSPAPAPAQPQAQPVVEDAAVDQPVATEQVTTPVKKRTIKSPDAQ